MKVELQKTIQQRVLNNPNFVKWFGNSKVRTKYGKPRIVFHGTLSGNLEVFDIEKTNIHNFFGKGFYFSSSEHDVNKNYATPQGADIKNRLNYIIDYEFSFEDMRGKKDQIVSEYSKRFTKDQIRDIGGYAVLEYQALRDYVLKHPEEFGLNLTENPSVIPCFLRMQKPCYIGFGDRYDTKFYYKEYYDEETGEYTQEPTGTAVDMINVLSSYTENLDGVYEKILDNNGYITSTQLLEVLKEDSELFDEWIDDLGGAGGVFSEVLQVLGYDGIIQKPSYHFNMKNIGNAIHYIVWEPNQIKSAYGNNGNYSLSSNNIKENTTEQFNEAFSYDFYKDKLDKELIDELRAVDPTNDAKYTPWIIKNFMDAYYTEVKKASRIAYIANNPNNPLLKKLGQQETISYYVNPPLTLQKLKDYLQYYDVSGVIKRLYYEDIDKTTEDLKWYTKLKNKNILKPEEKNILNIKGFKALWELINRDYADQVQKLKDNEPLSSDEATKLYEDSGWLVVVPKTEKAACKYGSGTRWCTAASNNNMFERYNENGPLIIIIDKSNPRENKWQLHIESDQWMDVTDEQIENRQAFVDSLPKPVVDALYNFTKKFIFYPNKRQLLTDIMSDNKKARIFKKFLNRKRGTFENEKANTFTDYVDEDIYRNAINDVYYEELLHKSGDAYSYGYDNPKYYIEEPPANLEGDLSELEDCRACSGTGYSLFVKNNNGYWDSSLSKEVYERVLNAVKERFPEHEQEFINTYIQQPDGTYEPTENMPHLMKKLDQKCKFCNGSGKEDYDPDSPEVYSEEQREQAAQESADEWIDKQLEELASALDSNSSRNYSDYNFDSVSYDKHHEIASAVIDLLTNNKESINTIINLMELWEIDHLPEELMPDQQPEIEQQQE